MHTGSRNATANTETTSITGIHSMTTKASSPHNKVTYGGVMGAVHAIKSRDDGRVTAPACGTTQTTSTQARNMHVNTHSQFFPIAPAAHVEASSSEIAVTTSREAS